MKRIGTEILVIGGGATGLSAARDALLRGFKTLLIEKGDLAHGTSGRYHGLLHSGARYVISDPQSAKECYQENQILRKLIPRAIEDTGGLFVATEHDPIEYYEPFLAGCLAAGIPAEPISPAETLRQEPRLTPRMIHSVRVPDGSCDSFDATHLLAADIRARGGVLWLRHSVVRLVVENGRVRGAVVQNLLNNEQTHITADIVLNCTGPWAGQIAQLAGISLNVSPGKGVMLATNVRLVNTVVNRLKPPDDGDILVPVGTVSVMGTTDERVPSADRYPMENWEIELLLREGEILVPGFRKQRALRAWAGVRPLYDPGANSASETRTLRRGHSVVSHAERDQLPGLLTMIGGKFTTMRLMAEHLLDAACAELKINRPCKTADSELLGEPEKRHYTLPERIAEVWNKEKEIICECEMVSRRQVLEHLQASDSAKLNDLRRDTRLGMGPCQAGFCAYRASGLASECLPLAAEAAVQELSQYLQERWKGQRPLLWGQTLVQTELDLHIYRNLLGLDRLPTSYDVELYPSERTS
ncbi:MAG TPA: anaerobic glycerol-3-phosphate dehydrogenase subunit GlpA [Anaerolineales bacterium]|nr:anaerobic glycerol-3-phosphate dehydrogenase subunit GlpA [Anaerolineales bacterium]